MIRLMVEPLTREAFVPFGEVLQLEGVERRLINGDTTERFHRLAEADIDESGRAIVSLFRGVPRSFPFEITMMERHPDGSQAFWPLSGRPWLAAVAPDEAGRAGHPRVFLAGPDQGVNYARGVWHHPLLVLDGVSDFLVVDRQGPGANLEEAFYDEPFLIAEPGLSKEE